MRLNRIFFDFGFSIGFGLDHGWGCVCLSRVLLLLTAIQLVTMPFTQYLWTWDHFLHGGRDFETGMLMMVTFLCFALLRAQDNHEKQESLLGFGIAHSVLVGHREHRQMLSGSQVWGVGQKPERPFPLCSLPLLI